MTHLSVNHVYGQTGAYEIGDCLVGEQFSSCRSYLIQHSAHKDGTDYLTTRECPDCEEIYFHNAIEPIAPYWQAICPGEHIWSKPNNAELDLANPRYDVAESGEVGARVAYFESRLCWRGGDCVKGPCDVYVQESGNTSGPGLGARCKKTGGAIFYIYKRFGALCDVPEEDPSSGDGSGDSENVDQPDEGTYTN